jgi:hypothetical protein
MNRLTSLGTPLSSLTRLRQLRVIGNQLTNFGGIETCVELQQLHAQVFVVCIRLLHVSSFFNQTLFKIVNLLA